MKKCIPLVVVILLTGCAGSPMRISMMSADGLKKESSKNLCNGYHFSPSELIESELKSRNEISADEWNAIKQKKIHVGMSELALVCSWGDPSIEGNNVHESVGSWGSHKQWVYHSCPSVSCPAQYVYTENGTVVSWQNN